MRKPGSKGAPTAKALKDSAVKKMKHGGLVKSGIAKACGAVMDDRRKVTKILLGGKMDWFQNKTTQLIALAGIVSTLAGFGYTGATYVNRIENLESKMTRYINEIDALGDQVTALDKNVVAVGEQIKSLNVETQDLSPIKGRHCCIANKCCWY